MAEAVTVQFGDSLTKILKNRRGIRDHEVPAWLGKLRPMNPHISDLNRIFPGETVLIPDSYLEIVADAQVWQNAFSGIPRALEFPHNGHTQLFWTGPGVTIDSVAEGMFSGGRYQNMPLSTKRAVLIHNNPDLETFLDSGRLPANLLVDITPLRLSKFDIHYWQGQRQLYRSYLQGMDPTTRDMFQDQGPEKSTIISRMIDELKKAGSSVGKDDIVKGIGYGVGGWSGLAASGEMTVSGIHSLMQQMAADVVEKFGAKVAVSNKAAHLTRVAKFLKSHPNYPLVMRQTQEVPQLLLPLSRANLMPPPAANVDAASLARWFRKGYFQSFRRLALGRYMGPIARQLNGRISMFKALGRHATWYIPAVIGLYNVFDAAPEVRMRTLFEEGFGVVGGAFGTKIGAAAGLGIVALLGLGPFGLFVAVFICATAGGIAGNELFKWGGGKVYDAGAEFSDHIFHSMDEFIGAHY